MFSENLANIIQGWVTYVPVMGNSSTLLTVLLLSLLAKLGDGVRCYTCRSDELPDCGDPFNPGRVPSNECDNYFTQQTFTCFKATHYGFVSFYPLLFITYLILAAGQYITVRGCAPFTTENFPGMMQKGMVGTYWKVKIISF